MTTKPILACDLDGTLFREALLTLFCHECFRAGIMSAVAEREFNDMYLAHRDRIVSHREFDRSVLTFFYRHIAGVSVADGEAMAIEAARRNVGLVYRFTATLLKLHALTHTRVIVTGTVGEMARAIKPLFGFEFAYASELERTGGLYTGRDLYNEEHDKGDVLLAHAGGAALKESIAIGDTAADMPMLLIVGYPIAFNPTYDLATAAKRHRWPIVQEGKGKILVLTNGENWLFSTDEAEAAVAKALSLSPQKPLKKEEVK